MVTLSEELATIAPEKCTPYVLADLSRKALRLENRIEESEMKGTDEKIVTLRADLALLVKPEVWGIIDVMLSYLGDWREEGAINDLQGRGLINEDGSIK